MQRTKTIAGVQDYDEESYTSTILGGTAIAAPLLAAFEGQASAGRADFRFGTFRKNGGAKSPLSETATGADFCLVIGHDDEHAKVAIFQAKKLDPSEDERLLSVRRGPASTSDGHFQFTMLLAFTCRLMAKAGLSGYEDFADDADTLGAAARLKSMSVGDISILVKEISWVHYMVYRNGDATTLPLNNLDKACITSEVFKGRQYSHRLGGTRPGFVEIVSGALQGSTEGWLLVPRMVIKAFLPELIEMGAIVVMDDKGGIGLTPDFDCINLASLEPIDGVQANPQNAAAVNTMISRPQSVPRNGM
ncbi:MULTISPECIES: hypothetical protein [Xanthomonas]|nr:MULTISPECIES: hypothetical protein [Xanthomonas]MCE4552478.1 hypothetical protein [Xanthomonas hortorum pv. vitians]MBZ2444508.1 hypothetical protein [Xanthomonas perforans]MBZ2500295.1 hypothetical protein [Xanthomonas perforans]MBZ2512889.1 hypothetical protein [Xanthomonas perforans]MBZ2522172.1 hypothetical protein [Xanthomonas perforans]